MGWSPFRPTGLTYHRPAKSYKGYTLVTPLRGDDTYLLDMAGRVVHRWHFTDLKPGYGRLLENGNLLILGNDPSAPIPPDASDGKSTLTLSQRYRGIGGNASRIWEVDWDGNLVWSYENEAIHHDFVRLSNGNTLLVQWIPMSEDQARSVRGGIRPPKKDAVTMLGDEFIEVNPAGEIVWRASLVDLLDGRKDAICPLENRGEWTHVNGLDVNDDDELLYSCRTNSAVGIIDRQSGTLMWKLPHGMVYHQHHPTWQAGRKVQLFDNGMHRPGPPRSRVVVINPENDEVEWEFTGKPEPQFLSANIAGADRMPNGNNLVCEGASGRLFEITSAGEVVWEWVSPFATGDGAAVNTQIFRAHRYGLDHPAISGRNIDPRGHVTLNRMHGLGPAWGPRGRRGH